MANHTKGKLKEVVECCNAVNLLSKEDGSQVAQVMDEEGDDLTDTQKANAKELIRRWNAFEENGLVTDLLAVCEAIKLRIHFIGLPSEPMNENRPDWSKEIALIESVITKTKKGFEDGKSTKDDS